MACYSVRPMDVQKQFLKLVEAKKQKVLEKKEAPLKWEQRLEMAAKAKADSKSKERDELKARKRSWKEQNLESAAGGDDSEDQRKRRKKHRKHKHSNSKHSKKYNRHDFDSSSEDSEESGSDEDRRRPSHRKGGHKHHKDHSVPVSGSASDAKEDHQQPLKLSTWCKEEDISSSESFDSSDKSRGQSRKHKKEKDKPHSRSNHHHHHHHHHLHHIDQMGSEQKPCAESQDKTTSEIHHCNGSIHTMPQTKVA